MLQNFIICVNAVIPSAIYLLIGILLKTAGVVSDEDVKKFTRVVFVTLYPFIMFDNLYGKNIGENFDLLLVVYSVLFTCLQIAVTWFAVSRLVKEDRNKGTMIQSAFRSNIILMGLPVGINLFGKGNVTQVALVILFVVPIYNVMSVVVLERFRGGKADLVRTTKNVLKNPIILGAIAAGVVMLIGIKLPVPIEQTVSTLSDCTAPIAMILLGAALNLKGFSSDRKKIAFCVASKIMIWPALGIAGAVWLGMRDVALIAVLLMLATPTALASYAMAESMGGNGRLAGETVVISTIGACFTMPVWLFILKTAGMF
ncbi:MAG: AEC family transporter [Mogibacterium sp.]|nr:AEC family transporter [Mogibacterium sp.]MBQ3429042.1 AEC family transporter [Mogibacterium sp.]